MSGPPMVKSTNSTEPEARPVLVPAGNKSAAVESRKTALKPKCDRSPDVEPQSPEMVKLPSPPGSRRNASSAAAILRQRPVNLSLNASCSSDASTDSSHSRASTGRISRRSGNSTPCYRRKQQQQQQQCGSKGGGSECGDGVVVMDGDLVKKRCAWVTSNTDPLYSAFHDEEWGLPVHDDKKLFELLSFSTALAELTWPVILNKRPIFRDVFLDFDPTAVSKLTDKKIATPGSPASSLLSEQKLRAIVENARQICKIIDEHGSFDKYIWSFVNYKPIVSNFRYPRQVPIKTSKADTISKDLVRRGFRGVGPTVVYSFMQVAGITNDHLINCFRFQDCIVADDLKDKVDSITSKNETNPHEELEELTRDIDDLNLSR